MARKADKNSKRQQAFALLDEMLDAPRQEAYEALMKEFDIGLSYAKTLYQNHRVLKKEEGEFIDAFIVRDMKNGREVTPYMSKVSVLKPSGLEGKTQDEAIKKYIRHLGEKEKLAAELSGTEDVVTRGPKH